jgi:hypothetical protein
MKKFVVLLILLSGYCPLFAQGKEDNIWVLGYNPNDSLAGYGGTMLDFSVAPVKVSYFPILVDAAPGSPAQICSPAGDFLFFSNGCKIVNNHAQLVENGDEINPGTLHNEWCNTGDDHGYGTHQGSIALPWPGRSGQYAMFHLGWYRTGNWPPNQYIRDFYVTHIDMNAREGLGAVVEKNTVLLQDSNLVDNLTAVRHGNGRDWWLVEPRGLTDSFYLFLLTPYGIRGPFIEKTGLRSGGLGFTGGQVVFSPDGTKYVRVNKKDGVDIFDFDRCRGKFICGKRLPFPGGPQDGIMGAAISPSSRFLYVSALTKLFQYDLQADDIEASKILIDEYDWFRDSSTFALLPTTFYQQMLAPNGKIYMSIPNGTVFFHVIHQPDSAGVACDFRQHDLRLATHHGFCVPNFPHFRLYDLPASPCDSLGIDAPEAYRVLWSPSDAIRLFPNPIGMGTVTVTIPPCAGGLLRVFNAAGQFLAEYKVDQERQYPLDCSGLPNGVYVVTFSTGGRERPMVARLVVCR